MSCLSHSLYLHRVRTSIIHDNSDLKFLTVLDSCQLPRSISLTLHKPSLSLRAHMSNHSAIIHNRVPIIGDIGLIPVVHHSLVPVLLVIWATVVRAIVNDWKLLTVFFPLWRTFFGELKLYSLGFVEWITVRVFGLCGGGVLVTMSFWH
jgi:hypothetical protein